MRPTLSVRLEGHLTRDQLKDALARVTPALGSDEPLRLLVDCSEMVGYDLDARHAFVEWLREHTPGRVAILTDRALWRMVISSMSLASSVPLRPFADRTAAEGWLRG